MLSCPRGGHDLFGMIEWITADGQNVNIRIREHFLEIVEGSNRPTVFQTERFSILFAGRIDSRYLPQGCSVNRRDMRGGDPAITHNANIIFLHECPGTAQPLASLVKRKFVSDLIPSLGKEESFSEF